MRATAGVLMTWGINTGMFGATLGAAVVGHQISYLLLAVQVAVLIVGFELANWSIRGRVSK